MSIREPLNSVRVPASTSNLGAGFDCVGLALDLWLQAEIVKGEAPADYRGTLTGFDAGVDFTLKAVGESIPAGHHLRVSSDIPLSRGLGSSAAAIVAGFALRQIIDHGRVDRESVFELATMQEGHPDNAGPAVYGGLFLDAGVPKQLVFHQDLAVALAVPDKEISTQEARGLIPAQLSRGDAIAQASSSAALIVGLTTGDGALIRQGMIDRIAVPVRKSMIEGYDDAVGAGLDAGAFGVTISGAGSTLVAICPKDNAAAVADCIAEALTERGTPSRALNPTVVRSGLEIAKQ